jgi:hypothetical protein
MWQKLLGVFGKHLSKFSLFFYCTFTDVHSNQYEREVNSKKKEKFGKGFAKHPHRHPFNYQNCDQVIFVVFPLRSQP